MEASNSRVVLPHPVCSPRFLCLVRCGVCQSPDANELFLLAGSWSAEGSGWGWTVGRTGHGQGWPQLHQQEAGKRNHCGL